MLLLRASPLLLVFLACSDDSIAPPADAGFEAAQPAADPTGFHAAGTLHVGRAQATATLLRDGRVLVVGGEDTNYGMLASVEIYDPATETFQDAAPLPAPRDFHSATLLPNGQVLVAGGGTGSKISLPDGNGTLASAVLYDPIANAWSPAADMHGARAGHRAVTLADGRVLVVGGGAGVGYACDSIHPNCTIATSIASAEIYDPTSGTWSDAEPMKQARIGFALTMTPGGVVASGGAANNQGLTSVELYDPASGHWSDGPALTGQRLYLSAAVLSGELVVAGGKIANVAPVTSVDVLDVGASSWRPGQSLTEARTGASFVPLQSGRGLLVAGNDQLGTQFLAAAALYDTASDAWTPITALAKGRYSQVAVALTDGSVVVIGGRDAGGVMKSAERTQSDP